MTRLSRANPEPSTSDREVVSTVLADRILSFAGETGLLRAEAGRVVLRVGSGSYRFVVR